MTQSGTLYIVPTPIGNLSDISQRALDCLSDADVIACEDTRHTARLLNHYDIKSKTISLHDHNESQRSKWLVSRLVNGENIALVSDAGTPLISDPGYVFVKACREANVNVLALPGPCALTTALSASGLPSDKFSFFGFLPVKKQAKQDALKKLVKKGVTSIFYESPRRIKDTLEACVDVFDTEHEIVIAKELTKTFETFVSGDSQHVLAWLIEDEVHQKGEFVLMIHYAMPKQETFSDAALQLMNILMKELPPKKAASVVAQHYGLKKNALYKHALENFNE